MTEEQYRDKVRRELLASRTAAQTGFRDEFGYIDDFSGGNLTPDGEGTLNTAIAAIALATGNYHQDDWEVAQANQRILELITSLHDGGWGNPDGLGRVYPVRHPKVFDYNSAGVAFRKTPMSKDAFGPVIAACYYAFKCPHSSDAVRAISVKLIQKWIELLIFSQWNLHPDVFAGEYEQDTSGKNYKNIFSDSHGGQVKFKGPDTYILLPHEIYAIQSVGAALGQQTSDWNVWSGGMLPEIKQTIINIIAPYAGDACKRAMSAILDKLEIAIPYDIPLGGPGWNFGSLKGVFAFGIPSDVRMAIATSFGNAIRDIIEEMARLDNLLNLQASELLDTAISRILDGLPGALGPDKWRSILTLGMKQVSPWIDGSIWVEALTFAATLQLLKTQPTFVQSYTLWSYAVTFETRPDLADLLRPLVKEFFSALRGQGNPIGMWAWLAEDTGRVNEQLATFYNASPYLWKSFAYGSTAYDTWLVQEVVITPETSDGVPNSANPQTPRKDYLVLQGLSEKGTPPGMTGVAEDWLNLFRQAAGDLFNSFLSSAKQEIEHLGIVAIDGLSKVDFHTDSPLIPPVHIHG